ncbi:hypothetical protein PR048_010055 [Dryococelus australis]|uniref:HAT C-terminal dimerisation domain-containing protein n=1 Tax=Dryococelus australis TaxID=614101 RepID=A0ABQ9I1N1_9NEOP|nr:hypothetical protein PR048_010055 [Dryococelus australis]
MKGDKDVSVISLTKAFVEANIPLENLSEPSLKNFVETFVPGGVQLPCIKTLRDAYVPRIKEAAEEQWKESTAGQDVAVLCDETADKQGQCIFVVLFKTLQATDQQTLLVAGVQVLENSNANECLQAILEILSKYEIDHTRVTAIVLDSARYTTKCVNSVQVVLSSEEKRLVLFPSPILTRWNSSFESVEYVNEYLEDLVAYLKLLNVESTVALQHFKRLSKEELAIIHISEKGFLEGYSAFKQIVTGKIKHSENGIDVLQILLSLKLNHTTFACNALKAVWIPISNVDSERAFSAHSDVFSDKRRSLKLENVELMVSLYFKDKI